jgi:protein SCO1/2
MAVPIAAALLAGCHAGQPQFKSVDVTGSEWGKKLALTGHDGKPRTLADFQGRIVVLTFGFTHCPDVCPTTLAAAAQALKDLGRDASRVQVLFVTLDPERDTQEVLAKYVPSFDPRFLGLYGNAEATARTAGEFKIFYKKRNGSSPDSYSVDHSAQVYVLDANGRLRLFVEHERIAEFLAHDLRELLKEKR